MIKPEELLFTVDENNNPIAPVIRKTTHENGLWHRTSGIWVINRNRKILCQKRSLKKDVKPGFWEAFFGGHLEKGETYVENAVSELNQELGFSVKETDFYSYKVFKSVSSHKEFQHVFAVVLAEEKNDFQFEKEEIDELKWIELEEVRKILVIDKSENWVKKPWDDEVLNWLLTLLPS